MFNGEYGAGSNCVRDLQGFEGFEGTVWLVEEEGEDGTASLDPLAVEGPHFGVPFDVKGHLALGAGHLELQTLSSL